MVSTANTHPYNKDKVLRCRHQASTSGVPQTLQLRVAAPELCRQLNLHNEVLTQHTIKQQEHTVILAKLQQQNTSILAMLDERLPTRADDAQRFLPAPPEAPSTLPPLPGAPMPPMSPYPMSPYAFPPPFDYRYSQFDNRYFISLLFHYYTLFNFYYIISLLFHCRCRSPHWTKII